MFETTRESEFSFRRSKFFSSEVSFRETRLLTLSILER